MSESNFVSAKHPVPETQEELEGQYVTLMRRLGPIWAATGRTTNTPTGRECFAAHLEHQITNAIEMVPVRRMPGSVKIQILMFPRSKEVGPGNPPEYAGRLHSPGCMQMWGMNPRAGLDRVVAKETGVPYRVIGSLGPNLDVKRSPRGWEMSLVYIVQLLGELPPDSTGVWVRIAALEDLFIRDELIRAQYDDFLARVAVWAQANREQIS